MFSVVWSSSAQSDYTIIAFSNFDRSRDIELAGDEIDDKLKRNPTGSGQHLSEGLWRIESGPMVAVYSIDGNRVSVDAVHWVG